MRRAVLTLGGTVAGLAALLSFKSHPAVQAAAVSPAPLATPAATPTRPAAPLASPTTTPSRQPVRPKKHKASPAPTKATAPPVAPTTRPPATPASTPPPSPTQPAGKSGTFTGPSVNTQWGPVEVQVTLSAGKITNATDLIQPEDSVASYAVNQLNNEVLSAQSAHVQAVSGATYTSEGYLSSLQSAVAQAGL